MKPALSALFERQAEENLRQVVSYAVQRGSLLTQECSLTEVDGRVRVVVVAEVNSEELLRDLNRPRIL